MRRSFFIAVVIAACFVLGASAQKINPKDSSTIPRITQTGFQPLQADGSVFVLDVRDKASYDEGHIPGAYNIPLTDIENRLDELKTKAAGRPIVAYCACLAERTAAEAGLVLYRHGITNMRALVGGWHEWVRSGGKVEKGGS